MTVSHPDINLNALREIRLHCYRGMIGCRLYADEPDSTPDIAKHYRKMADKHLLRVQALDVFFDPEDTAAAEYK